MLRSEEALVRASGLCGCLPSETSRHCRDNKSQKTIIFDLHLLGWEIYENVPLGTQIIVT